MKFENVEQCFTMITWMLLSHCGSEGIKHAIRVGNEVIRHKPSTQQPKEFVGEAPMRHSQILFNQAALSTEHPEDGVVEPYVDVGVCHYIPRGQFYSIGQDQRRSPFPATPSDAKCQWTVSTPVCGCLVGIGIARSCWHRCSNSYCSPATFSSLVMRSDSGVRVRRNKTRSLNAEPLIHVWALALSWPCCSGARPRSLMSI